jgi:hypothetical protein
VNKRGFVRLRGDGAQRPRLGQKQSKDETKKEQDEESARRRKSETKTKEREMLRAKTMGPLHDDRALGDGAPEEASFELRAR